MFVEILASQTQNGGLLNRDLNSLFLGQKYQQTWDFNTYLSTDNRK